MPESDAPEGTLRAIQRSHLLARAGIILGILPPVLVWPLYVIYRLWIARLVPNYWQECQSFSCPPQEFASGLAYLFFLGPSILAAGAAMICGYIGIKYWPRYPTERLIIFNLSIALGMLWMVIFMPIWGAFTMLAG